jgi:hypothetical protein
MTILSPDYVSKATKIILHATATGDFESAEKALEALASRIRTQKEMDAETRIEKAGICVQSAIPIGMYPDALSADDEDFAF